ncbi:MAG: ArsR/SmtB family transcription factor [Candidatus Bathyarchaeia archaeon]|jgi:ArsR family transcriptional regulator
MASEKSKKNNVADYPKEVKDAIDEIGGLDLILNAVKTDDIEKEAKLHRILSDKTRLTVLKAIKQCDLCPCVIKVLIKISDSRLSYHLTVLEEAGLITSYKKKNWKIYKITEKGRSL